MELMPLLLCILLIRVFHPLLMKLILFLGTWDGKVSDELLKKYKIKEND